jgi:predicted membrane channel-forming protein YqfA (hemolysin III family)
MNRMTSALIWLVVGLTVLVAAAPILLRLAHALVPLVLVVGVVVGTLRAVWFYTR